MEPSNHTVLDHVRRQVDQHPHAPAIIDRQTTLTYADLDRQSNAVAAYLIERGVQPGDLVPLLADRSAALIVGLLGISKAGAGYVPIDVSYPAQRKQFIVAQTGAAFALATSESAPSIDDVECVSIAELTTACASATARRPSPQQVAYVIFTSGTTGMPKGVVIEHRSLENLVAWHNREFLVQPSSRLTLMAKVGFDVSQWEIWSALCAGAPLYLLDDETRIDAPALAAFYARNGITHAFVPTVMVADVVAATSSLQTSLRYLFTAGEKLCPVDTDRAAYALVDYYGPTEATIFATAHRVVSATLKPPSSIGVPIAGAQVIILDDALADVAVGEIGELCIAGPGLARGYLNNKALTDEKFIVRNGTRLYRSGDLARFLPDGSLQFLGRRDEQIKIRGNRVELGEIEAQLSLLPQIRKATVIVTAPADAARKEIVAFLVAADNPLRNDDWAASIKTSLKAVLPDYMLPAHYLFIDDVPLTANGKTDKQALLRIHARETGATAEDRTEYHGQQRILAGIFRDVLGHGEFGADDSFFDIGGHSLLAAQLMAAISDRLGVKAYIRDIYEHPSIASLGAELTRRSNAAASAVDGEPIRALLDDVHLPADLRSIGPIICSSSLRPGRFCSRVSADSSAFISCRSCSAPRTPSSTARFVRATTSTHASGWWNR